MSNTRYESAKEAYARLGVDTDAAIETLKRIPISLHCWQGDDVRGFEDCSDRSGGIQATGNYCGAARTPKELMTDMDFALSLIPGKHRINLHANYAIFKGKPVDRDQIKPEHFEPWVAFAKERGLGIDFNPTFFSHPKARLATLSSDDDAIRTFWIDHAKACIEISAYFARELGTPTLMNIWIPDGYKDIPADRLSPRKRLRASLDEILETPYDRSLVKVAVESKVFGIGIESYTVGSHEFYMQYAAEKGILCLLDNGHFHPTECVSDKISSMLTYSDQVALHITRPVRWDSDHVVRLDDETREIAKEIIQCGYERTLIGLDFFDASINRIAAWVIGMHSVQKALLQALLTPYDQLSTLQADRKFTEIMALQEALKTMPIGDVWNAFCDQFDVDGTFGWYETVKAYERDVLAKRNEA